MLDTSNWKVGTVVGYVETKQRQERATENKNADFWLIGVASPPHEAETCKRILESGIPLYLPKDQKQIRAGRGRLRDIVVPLIRPYFFVPASISEQQYLDVKAIRGVLDFLHIDGKPAVIKDRELERARREEQRRDELRLRRILKSGKGPRYIVGEAVRITVGFMRFEARVHMASATKVEVELEQGMMLFGRRVVPVDLAHIQPAG